MENKEMPNCRNCKYYHGFEMPFTKEGGLEKYAGVCCKNIENTVLVHLIIERGYSGCSEWEEKAYGRSVL